MLRIRHIFAAALMLGGSSLAHAADMVLFDGKAALTIVHDDTNAAPLARAADLLARDIAALTGKQPQITTESAGAAGPEIIVGLASSPRIAALLKANGLSAASIAGKWETYGRAAISDNGRPALLIFGSDVRGAIWGVTDLSRELGVSPFEWWADVTIRRRNTLNVDGTLRYSHTPSVKYRGIFLNDEEFGLWPWAANTYDPKLHDLGPKTYARVFELMWRLKANIFWPAMRGIGKSFNQVEGNNALASAYGLVRASSHAEMMTRTNLREWDEEVRGPYNYKENKENVMEYWREAVRNAKPYETMYSVGMRGLEDRPIPGANTPQDQARLLEKVLGDEEKMLGETLGRPVETIPQVFTPYKEVLPAYDAGLKVPDYVTLNWPDDNYGYIRRLSNAKERARSGGSGVYYHISYWGYPMSYLLMANTHPALMWEEMTKAYKMDARRMWILNVGDIKPGEYLTQFFLDLAFDSERYPDIGSVKQHLRGFAAENFGDATADPIADILWRQYDLAFDRNPEFMAFTRTLPATPVRQTDFNMNEFGDENARRISAYTKLDQEVAGLAARTASDRKDAFYEMVQFPVNVASAFNRRQLNLDKAIGYAMQRRASANDYGAAVEKAQADIDAAGRKFNEEIAGGKWRYMMGMKPHGLAVYQNPFVPVWKSEGNSGCGMVTESGAIFDGRGSTPGEPVEFFNKLPHLIRVHSPVLTLFHPELQNSRFVDLYLQSPDTVKWTATADVPWIKISTTGGTFTPDKLEERVNIAIDWATAPKEGKGIVSFQCEGGLRTFPVGVNIAPENKVPGVSFMEFNRIVSMYASHADDMTAGWKVMEGLGHTGASLQAGLDTPTIRGTDEAAIRKAPSATWRFSTTTTEDPATLKVIALPFLPLTADNAMRAAVAIDNGPLHILDFAAPEFSQRWQNHVEVNAAEESVPGLRLAPGAHSVTVYALDPGFTLDRLEVAFIGAPKAYLPVPETRIRAAAK